MKTIKVPKNGMLVVKVGSDERPAGPADIKNIQKALKRLFKKGHNTLVTHHCLDFVAVKFSGKQKKLVSIRAG